MFDSVYVLLLISNITGRLYLISSSVAASNFVNEINHPIILFDGVCNLCNGFIQFIITRDKDNLFRFGSLQSDAVEKILAKLATDKEYLSTVILVDGDSFYTESDAILRIVRHLKWWRWSYGFIILPRFLRDAVYRFISRHRYQVFGKRESCMVPTPELLDRFLR